MVDDRNEAPTAERPTPDEARAWLVKHGKGRAPNITVTWTERNWTSEERATLARILFGPKPESPGTRKP